MKNKGLINNQLYLIIFLLLLLPFSITTDSEYNESLEDYDGDGLPDAYELANDNDPYDRNDISKDADGDGLTIQEEFIHGTSDQNPDTDFDTLPDGWEVAQGRNPLLADYQISTGAKSSCALTDNGVVCWGKDNGSLNVPTLYNPTAIAVGSTFACALENSEEICWGNNQESLIGKPNLNESACSIEESGIICQDEGMFGSPPLIENAAQVSAGESSACALAPNGVTCWGYNLNGENDVPALVIDPDGDGYSNQGGVDAFPLDPTRWMEEIASIEVNQTIDTNGNVVDDDGVLYTSDVFPLIGSFNGTTNTDADSAPNTCDAECLVTGMFEDTDGNGDGILDVDNLLPLSLAPTLTLTYAGSNTAIPWTNITVTESDGTSTVLTTDANGEVNLGTITNTYSLSTNLAETGPDPISLLDALYIIQHEGELRTLSALQLKAADVNDDGEVDLLDAIWIIQHLGGLRTLSSSLIFLDGNTGNPLSETTFSLTDSPNISVIRMGDVDQDFDPPSPPVITSLAFYIDEDALIASESLDITDPDGGSVTISIIQYPDNDFTPTHTLGNANGSPYSLTSDLTINDDEVYELVSDVTIKSGAKLTIAAGGALVGKDTLTNGTYKYCDDDYDWSWHSTSIHEYATLIDPGIGYYLSCYAFKRQDIWMDNGSLIASGSSAKLAHLRNLGIWFKNGGNGGKTTPTSFVNLNNTHWFGGATQEFGGGEGSSSGDPNFYNNSHMQSYDGEFIVQNSYLKWVNSAGDLWLKSNSTGDFILKDNIIEHIGSITNTFLSDNDLNPILSPYRYKKRITGNLIIGERIWSTWNGVKSGGLIAQDVVKKYAFFGYNSLLEGLADDGKRYYLAENNTLLPDALYGFSCGGYGGFSHENNSNWTWVKKNYFGKSSVSQSREYIREVNCSLPNYKILISPDPYGIFSPTQYTVIPEFSLTSDNKIESKSRYDYESLATKDYSVKIRAEDSFGGVSNITVKINFRDVSEL